MEGSGLKGLGYFCTPRVQSLGSNQGAVFRVLDFKLDRVWGVRFRTLVDA